MENGHNNTKWKNPIIILLNTIEYNAIQSVQNTITIFGAVIPYSLFDIAN
jgi:hypothetical protein